jgi:hypothetical protein
MFRSVQISVISEINGRGFLYAHRVLSVNPGSYQGSGFSRRSALRPSTRRSACTRSEKM